MEYQKIINLLDDTTNQQSKFRTKNRIKMNDQSRGSYSIRNQIKLNTSMIRLIYVIIVMYTYMFKELLQFQLLQQQQLQIIKIKI